MRPSEDDLFRDDLADRRIDRDQSREPHRHPRCIVAAPIAAHAAVDTSIVPVRCPACHGQVYVPTDSNLERVDCYECDAQLVTRRDVADVVSLAILKRGAL